MPTKPNRLLTPPCGIFALGLVMCLLFFVASDSVAASGPLITNVSSPGVTSSSATIIWTTDTASDSQVAYGTTSAYGLFSALDTGLVTSHTLTISGLAP